MPLHIFYLNPFFPLYRIGCKPTISQHYPSSLFFSFFALMASLSSESAVEGIPEMDVALLMALLEDPPQLEEAEDERLRCVIRSLEKEIGSNLVAGGGAAEAGCGWFEEDKGRVVVGEGRDCSISTSDVDGALDWVEMEVEAEPNWYLGLCNEEAGMMGYGEESIYSSPSFYCYGGEAFVATTTEQECIPLWQDTYDLHMYG